MNVIAQWFGENSNMAIKVFALIFSALVINTVLQFLINRLEKRLNKNKLHWDDICARAIKAPATALLLLLSVSWSIQLINQNQDNVLFNEIDVVRDIGFLIIIAWFFWRAVREGEIVYKANARDNYDLTTIIAIARLLRIAILITVTLIALQALGYSINGLLAFGGAGGIAVGFAAKDMMANFFGGMVIYLDKPFVVGDWVRSPDREIEGTVEDIGWRITKIRTFDKRPLYVPNAFFMNIALENPSRMLNRRIHETIGIRYEDFQKLPDIVADVKAMLEQHDDIESNQTLMVNFNQFAHSSLEFFIYTFTKTTSWTRYHEVKQDVLFKTIEIVNDHDAQIAFPTSTIHFAQTSEDLQANQKDAEDEDFSVEDKAPKNPSKAKGPDMGE